MINTTEIGYWYLHGWCARGHEVVAGVEMRVELEGTGAFRLFNKGEQSPPEAPCNVCGLPFTVVSARKRRNARLERISQAERELRQTDGLEVLTDREVHLIARVLTDIRGMYADDEGFNAGPRMMRQALGYLFTPKGVHWLMGCFTFPEQMSRGSGSKKGSAEGASERRSPKGTASRRQT